MEDFREIEKKGLAEIVVFDGVGVEKFAEHGSFYAQDLVDEMTNAQMLCGKL